MKVKKTRNNNIYLMIIFISISFFSSIGFSTIQSSILDINFNGIYNEVNAKCEQLIEEIRQELNNAESGSMYLLKTGGTTDGDYTFNGKIVADNISNSNRSKCFI